MTAAGGEVNGRGGGIQQTGRIPSDGNKEWTY